MNPQNTTAIQTTPSTIDSGTPGSILFNVGGSLALVLLLIAAIAWVARRAGFRTQGGKSSALLTVKCSQSLGQRERVVIVEADDKWFLLGVTPTNINCLATLNKQSDSDEVASSPLSGDFQNVLLNMLKKRKPESPQ
ncbi:flagellar biosynthetic protein FliO [Obesumbacterium proteus]|uniref:Flagellar protein n=1 Tax=Obesumbacterium proteus ATCC 12841 TaxID=1354268 RepID=A0AA91EHL1_9GAMM|nr:flagellar biosynthetic protein FliO [Obesumbacterium proteus]AMO83535.1 hypothetical protein DSM2777_22325 [Obesumbacterium proteus]OAT59345.1 FliQ family flagellar biosynthesis protein [Obesumbacterium proteus ATCC 12841]